MTTVFQLLNEFADALDAGAKKLDDSVIDDMQDQVLAREDEIALKSAIGIAALLAQAIRDTIKGKTDRAPPGIH